MRRWTEIDDRRLTKLWADDRLTIEAIAFEMDRNPTTIKNNALKLGLGPRRERMTKPVGHRAERRAHAHRV